MTALDLDAIKARFTDSELSGATTFTAKILISAADVPALVAEVERQATALRKIESLVGDATIPNLTGHALDAWVIASDALRPPITLSVKTSKVFHALGRRGGTPADRKSSDSSSIGSGS